MLDGIRVLGRGLNSVRLNGYAYIWANIAFVALSLPLITMPAAYSALVRVAHVAQTEPSEADLAMFWDTFKSNFWRSLPWGLANLVFAYVNFTNLIAYNDAQGTFIEVLRVLWYASTIIWAGTLLYTWSIFYEMETPHLWQALRNALIMILYNPIFTLTILAGVALLSAISVVLVALWMLLTFSVIAAIGNAAVLDRLARYRATRGAAS